MIPTATVHAGKSLQQLKASAAEFSKKAGNLQCTEQAIHARSRSNSCIDASTFAKGDRLHHQNMEEEFCLWTGNNVIVRNRPESAATSGFTTKL